ncbi:ABC transporter ATP-binding protein, partial [Treponema pedis]
MKLKLIINSIKLAFLASPFYFIFLIFVSVASGLSYGFVTQRTAIFFSTLENIKSAENFQFFYFNLTFFITALCLNFFLNGFINYLIEIDAKKISTITNIKLHKKINSFPVSFFESAENLEKISAAREGAFINGYIAMIVVTFFSSTIPSIISMSYFLFKINFTLGFSCIGIIIPNLIIFKKQWKNFEEADAGLLEAKRKRNYTEEMLTSKIFFKETRTLNIEPFLMEKYERHAIEYEDRSIFVKIQNLKLDLKSNIINFIFYILIFSFSLYLALNGKISISGFGTFFTSIGTMIFLIEQIFDNDFSVVRDSLPEL